MKVLADRISGLEIAKGDVPKHSCINKFGQALTIDVADGFVDVWDGVDSSLATGKIPHYTYSETDNIDSISSSNQNDTEPITVYGLDRYWNPVIQTPVLEGQARVILGVPLIRAYRMENAGSSDLVGQVYCYVNGAVTDGVPNDPSKVRAIIKGGNNQTQMTLFTIPNGMTGYLDYFDAYVSQKKDQLSDIELRFRPFGGVFQLKRPISIGAGSPALRPFRYPEIAAAKTDIAIRADTSKADGSVSAGFDLALVRQE